MRRVDRLLGEARRLRAMRAARAKGLIPMAGYDWLAEADTAQAILEDLAEGSEVEITDPRRKAGPVRLVDPATLAPFVERCERALLEAVAEMRPVAVMGDDLMAKLGEASASTLAAFLGRRGRDEPGGSPSEPKDGAPRKGRQRGPVEDPLAPRRQLAEDVATLAVEAMLLEAVRRVFWSNDLARPTPATYGKQLKDGELKTRQLKSASSAPLEERTPRPVSRISTSRFFR